MSEWKEMELGDFVELKRGYDLPKKKREPGEVPLISSSGESDFHSEAKVKGPGVVTGRYGTIGEVFYVEDDFWPLNTTLYVKDFKGNDPLFVYYFLKTISYSDYSDKAAVPGINRNHLHKAIIHVPVDPIYQRELAEKLRALDTKIELNRQTNQTLEHIAQAIFKSWFVDFEPTRAKIAAKQVGRARQDGERSAALREALLSEGCWPEAIAGAIAEGDPERAAMAAISGKSLEELDRLSPEQQEQLLTTAALFPDALIDSELGEIPERWEVAPLNKLLDVRKGLSYKGKHISENSEDMLMINLGNFGGQGKFRYEKVKYYDGEYKPRHVAQKGQLVLANTDMTQDRIVLGSPALIPDLGKEEVLFTHHTFCVDFEDDYPENEWKLFSYFSFLQPSFRERAEGFATGTTVLALPKDALLKCEAVIPDENIVKKFNDNVLSVFERLSKNIEENNTLEAIRDALLPKLLAGEMEAENAN